MKVISSLVLVALVLPSASGCGALCPDAARGRAVEAAAWNADAKTMRELLDSKAPANGNTCSINRDAQTPLFIAAWHGDAPNVTLLLAHGATVDHRDAGDYTPLHLAASSGHDEVVALLIKAGANVNARNKDGATPLATAAEKGHFIAVKYLLAAGADANSRQDRGWTPLHSAASGGYADIVRLLLSSGAKPDATLDGGGTALSLALVGHHDDVVQLLASNPASVNTGNKDTTPLALAISMGDPDGVRVLLEKEADANAHTPRGSTLLQVAIRERVPTDRSRAADQAIMRLLLDGGADVQARGKDGNTALHTAAWSNRADLAALLLERGAAVDARNDSGMTPLHYAAPAGHAEVVELLLKKGADVNATKNDRRTALIDVFGNEPMKALLRKHGAHE